MDFREAQFHACPLGPRLPEDVRALIDEQFTQHLWIDDHWERNWTFYGAEDDGKARKFHCENCGDEWVESTSRGGRWKGGTFKQGERVSCPRCGAKVVVKHMSRGFRSTREAVDVVFYRASELDPEAVVAYAAHCTRDYSMADEDAPWTLETDIDLRSLAVVKCGAGAWKFSKYAKWNGEHFMGYGWHQVKSMDAMSFKSSWLGNMTRRVVLKETLDEAIAGTPFERTWEDCYLYNHMMQDGLKALAMIARYPCVEYMTKLGMETFVHRQLAKSLPRNLINWRGKDMASVLKLKKARLAEIKGQKLTLTVELVAVLQWADRKGIRMGAKLAAALAMATRNDGADLLMMLERTLGLVPSGKRDKALKYIAKVGNRSDVYDYWGMELEIGGDLGDDAVAFPPNFIEAHERARTRRSHMADAALDVKIEARTEALAKEYGFVFGGLILRPAASSAEVIREGEALCHCVATYVKKYAGGMTNIFVLRRAVEPDAPWRTVEIGMNGTVVQDRGYHNDWGEQSLMTDEYRAALNCFWAAWKERKSA